MGVTVDIRNDGSMIVYRFDKNQQIYLSRESFLMLVDLREKVNETIESKSENKWPVGDQLFVQVVMYQGEIFVHLRVWWKNQPTKQGVTMSVGDWYHFTGYLQFDEEASIGLSVLENMLAEKLGDVIKKECEGCVQSYLSQTDHSCLMDPMSVANRHVNELFDSLNACKFILNLAKKAGEKNIVIEHPKQTFQLLRGIKEQDIKTNALSQFRY